MNDPNLPLHGTPAFDTLAPFTKTPPNGRGQRTQLDPPPGPLAIGPSLAVVEPRTDGTGRGRLVGVQLGLELKKGKTADYVQANTFAMAQIVGTIKWGIGSTEFEADFDWMHGSQIAVLAENVSVAARYVKNTIPWDPTPDDDSKYPSFVASAGVAYGAMPRISSGARLTKLVQLEEPADTVDIPIPPFAISFTVVPLFNSKVSPQLLAFGGYSMTYAIATPISTAGQSNVENTFPIWNGAEVLRVTNTEQASSAFAAVVFCLAL